MTAWTYIVFPYSCTRILLIGHCFYFFLIKLVSAYFAYTCYHIFHLANLLNKLITTKVTNNKEIINKQNPCLFFGSFSAMFYHQSIIHHHNTYTYSCAPPTTGLNITIMLSCIPYLFDTSRPKVLIPLNLTLPFKNLISAFG